LKKQLPAHCGLWVTSKKDGKAELIKVIQATKNEQRNGYMIASLLWHEEAKQLLIDLGLGKGEVVQLNRTELGRCF